MTPQRQLPAVPSEALVEAWFLDQSLQDASCGTRRLHGHRHPTRARNPAGDRIGMMDDRQARRNGLQDRDGEWFGQRAKNVAVRGPVQGFESGTRDGTQESDSIAQSRPYHLPNRIRPVLVATGRDQMPSGSRGGHFGRDMLQPFVRNPADGTHGHGKMRVGWKPKFCPQRGMLAGFRRPEAIDLKETYTNEFVRKAHAKYDRRQAQAAAPARVPAEEKQAQKK